MAMTVYLLCMLTSAVCAALLWREYHRASVRLLLWSSLSFVGWAVNGGSGSDAVRARLGRRIDMNTFLQGGVAMGCAVAGLFFLRFWRDSRDRLFMWFALAFWMLAGSYVLLGVISLATEWRVYVFVVRLAAFCFILVGIYEKNRQ
jgi:hypothetical protein